MPEENAIEKAREDKQAGKSPSTQAGEFVREEMHHVREGKQGARSPQQAIAIGLSPARRAGVALPPPKKAAQPKPVPKQNEILKGAKDRGGASLPAGGLAQRPALSSPKDAPRLLARTCLVTPVRSPGDVAADLGISQR